MGIVLRQAVTGLLLGLALSPAAQAGWSGQVGAVSDYLARGLDQTGGVTLQGGVDYAQDSGFYAGSLFSNVKWFDLNHDGVLDPSYEWDAYAGFAGTTGPLGYDVGVLNIGYPEAQKFNTVELYAGGSYRAERATFSGRLYYSPDRNAYLPNPKQQDAAGWYANLQAELRLQPGLTLTPQVGYAFGEALDASQYGGVDTFANYSLTLSKALDSGVSTTLAVVGTDRRGDSGKVVVGVKKTFAF